MRLLHTSDWHLGKALYERSLLEDQSAFLDWLLELMRSERPDALLIAGDVYHRPIPPAEAVALFDSFLSRAVLGLKIPVLAVAGNHDSGSRLEFAGDLLGSAGYHVAGKIRREIACVTLGDRHGPLMLWLLPWLFPADVRALLPESEARSFGAAYEALLKENLPRLGESGRNIILAHGFFTGGGAMVESESELSVGGMDQVDAGIFGAFDYAALGHLHAPQRAGERARYSGSPLKYSLSEEGQRKSVTLVELGEPGSPADIREIPVPILRDVRRVRGSFAQLMDPAWHINRAFGDYVFAEVTDEGELYPLEKLRALFPNLLGISFPLRESGEEAIVIGRTRERLTAEEHFARFYSEAVGEALPEGHRAQLRQAIESLEREREEVSLP